MQLLAVQAADEIGVDGCQARSHSQGDARKEPGGDPNDDLVGSGEKDTPKDRRKKQVY